MAMKRCEHGHFYDPAKHSTCPHCGIPDLVLDMTRPKRPPHHESEEEGFHQQRAKAGGVGRTEPIRDDQQERRDERHRSFNSQPDNTPPDLQRTVALVKEQTGIDPVVGWFVCVDGADKGRDYRIRSELNYIGRGREMDIYIDGDDTISRERHAAIGFDPESSTFTLLQGDGRGLVYLNGKPVYTPTELQPYDTIKLGQTILMFVPFCGEKFQWEAEED